jgi:hypothetical protein
MADTTDPKTVLAGLITRRDAVRESVQRVRGRLDSARSELEASEEECRKRKVDPDKINEVIATLTARLATETAALAAKIEAAEAKVAPYLKEEV